MPSQGEIAMESDDLVLFAGSMGEGLKEKVEIVHWAKMIEN